MTIQSVLQQAIIILVAAAWTSDAAAQIDVLETGKRAAEKEAQKSVNKAVKKAKTCVAGDKKCIKRAKKKGREVVIVDAEGNVVDAEGNVVDNEESTEQPGEGVWRNYDFTPGTRVIYASDWSNARVGRIPKDIKFIKGNMQIVEKDGQRVLEVSSASTFQILLDEPLPESFSIEFQAQTGAPNAFIKVFGEAFSEVGTAFARYDYHYLNFWRGAGIDFQGSNVSGATSLRPNESLNSVKFQIDEGYGIMYVGTTRVAQVPAMKMPQSNTIEFSIRANDKLRAFLSDIIIAYDVDDPYGSLMDDGEYTTRGIFFDTGKDTLRPESTPVLTQLLEMLEGHPDLESITIEGHTDSIGDEDYNLNLSARRADAVKTYLVGQGIDAARLNTIGRGETEPAADNATEAGRQENRRVVIRLPDVT